MTGPEQRAQALVLRAVDYGESDRIVTFFTRELGKASAFARGARKSQKRFGGALEPFNRLAIRFRDRRGELLSLASATVERARPAIVTDLDLIQRASYVTELIGESTREREPLPELFDLLDGGLETMGTAEFGALGLDARGGWLASFELKLLDLAGYRPDLSACAQCGDASADRYRFVPERGVLLCARDAGGAGIAVSAGTVRLLDATLAVPLDRLDRFAFSHQQVIEARRILGPFIRAQLGKELRSARFLES